jgi:hypothetical protein
MNFDLGTATPAVFELFIHSTNGVSKPYSNAIPAIVPPQPFTISLQPFPNLGNVTVGPTLAAQPGGPGLGLCAKWTTVNTAQ